LIQQQKSVWASSMQPLVGMWWRSSAHFYQWERGLAQIGPDALKYNVKLYYIVLYITNILDESEYKKNKGTYLLSQVFFTPIFTIHVL
jgi:hypothetical protein